MTNKRFIHFSKLNEIKRIAMDWLMPKIFCSAFWQRLHLQQLTQWSTTESTAYLHMYKQISNIVMLTFKAALVYVSVCAMLAKIICYGF